MLLSLLLLADSVPRAAVTARISGRFTWNLMGGRLAARLSVGRCEGHRDAVGNLVPCFCDSRVRLGGCFADFSRHGSIFLRCQLPDCLRSKSLEKVELEADEPSQSSKQADRGPLERMFPGTYGARLLQVRKQKESWRRWTVEDGNGDGGDAGPAPCMTCLLTVWEGLPKVKLCQRRTFVRVIDVVIAHIATNRKT